LIEIKAENEIDDKIVKLKAKAAIKYCKTASEINLKRRQKEWRYVLIPHDKVQSNMSFLRLVSEFVK